MPATSIYFSTGKIASMGLPAAPVINCRRNTVPSWLVFSTCYSVVSLSPGCPAQVDGLGRPRDRTGLVRGQEEHERGNLLRLDQALDCRGFEHHALYHLAFG